MESSYVLFVCGGKWQLPWLKYLKDKGHRILLVDPYTFSPCVPFADIHIACDARDVDGIFAQVHGKYKIDFVTSDQTDVSCLTVAELSRRLQLRGNSPEVVERFANKFKNREFVESQFTNHYPKFTKAYSARQLESFYSTATDAIMIKPVDAQSSRGIAKVDNSNIAMAPVLFETAQHFSQQDYIIAEEFLEGKEITVEGICIGGKHATLAISDKKHFRTGLASELRYPSVIRKDLIDQLTGFHNAFVERTGLDFGITHTEYIVNSDESDFWMVESACRGGGSLISSHIAKWVSSVDLYDALYRATIEAPIALPKTISAKPAVLHFFEFQSGRVSSIEGLEEARKIPGVISLEMEFKVGSQLKSATDDRSRQGYVIIFSETTRELEDSLNRVVETIKVSVE